MTEWGQMRPQHFDAALMRGKKAREWVTTAADSMFPDWLPPEVRKTTPAPAQMPGQADLFAEDE